MIVGPNARGKTTILEVLSLATILRSFRTASTQELIMSSTQQALMTIQMERPTVTKVSIGLSEKKKTIMVDEKSITTKARYPFLGGSLSFSPDDLALVKGSPDERRRFLDHFIVALDPQFSNFLQKYEKVLKQRNSLLRQIKEGRAHFEELPLWTESLIEAALPIYLERQKAIQILNEKFPLTYRQLFNSSENIEIQYMHRFPKSFDSRESLEQMMIEKLSWYADAERASGHSLVGPHKDDIEFKIDGMDARTFGSQGQTRGLVIALKVTQLMLTKEFRSFSPILLLDDIISELDDQRVQALVHYLSNYPGQMFVTTAEIGKISTLHREFSGFKLIDLGASKQPAKAISDRLNANLSPCDTSPKTLGF